MTPEQDPPHGEEPPRKDEDAQPGADLPETDQPDPAASSDGDGSWTDDPQTQDPDEDRSVEEVVRRTTGG